MELVCAGSVGEEMVPPLERALVADPWGDANTSSTGRPAATMVLMVFR